MTLTDQERGDVSSHAKVTTIRQLAKFIADGGGSFRLMCQAVGLAYQECYLAGGMRISNELFSAMNPHEFEIECACTTCEAYAKGRREALEEVPSG